MKKVLLYFMLVLICVNIILSGCTANYKTEESTQDQTEPVAEEPTINVNDILTNINSKNIPRQQILFLVCLTINLKKIKKKYLRQ